MSPLPKPKPNRSSTGKKPNRLSVGKNPLSPSTTPCSLATLPVLATCWTGVHRLTLSPVLLILVTGLAAPLVILLSENSWLAGAAPSRPSKKPSPSSKRRSPRKTILPSSKPPPRMPKIPSSSRPRKSAAEAGNAANAISAVIAAAIARAWIRLITTLPPLRVRAGLITPLILHTKGIYAAGNASVHFMELNIPRKCARRTFRRGIAYTRYVSGPSSYLLSADHTYLDERG